MFFQRDYILRMIEMMGDLMRRIKELMSDLLRMKLLSDASLRHTGISLETAEGLTKESLKELLQPMPRLMMSEILYTKAETFTLVAQEREELLHKSLHLLASLYEEGPLCELRADRLLEVKQAVFPRLNSEELFLCARFFSEAERFDHMEDALFQAVERLPLGSQREQLGKEGAALLEAAALQKPENLAFAHTSREELLASAKELREISTPHA